MKGLRPCAHAFVRASIGGESPPVTTLQHQPCQRGPLSGRYVAASAMQPCRVRQDVPTWNFQVPVLDPQLVIQPALLNCEIKAHRHRQVSSGTPCRPAFTGWNCIAVACFLPYAASPLLRPPPPNRWLKDSLGKAHLWCMHLPCMTNVSSSRGFNVLSWACACYHSCQRL